MQRNHLITEKKKYKVFWTVDYEYLYIAHNSGLKLKPNGHVAGIRKERIRLELRIQISSVCIRSLAVSPIYSVGISENILKVH